MKFDLQYDIFDCITELNRIAEELKRLRLTFSAVSSALTRRKRPKV